MLHLRGQFNATRGTWATAGFLSMSSKQYDNKEPCNKSDDDCQDVFHVFCVNITVSFVYGDGFEWMKAINFVVVS